MSIEWHGEEVFEAIRARVESRVEDAAKGLAVSMRESVGTLCPAYHASGATGCEWVSGEHATKGAPPFKETGDLYDSIDYKMTASEDPTAVVGSIRELKLTHDDPDYIMRLELGDHPWCLPALIMEKDNIRERIVGESVPF